MIILLVMILLGLIVSIFFLLMEIAIAYEDTRKMKPRKAMERSYDDCLLSRFEIEKRLWNMSREQKKLRR